MIDAEKFARTEPVECKLSSGETVLIHLFRPQDAPGIGDLFHAVYGDKYPFKRFYHPEELARALETGDNYSMVARKEENGKIIGHMGFFRSAPYSGLYEAGAGLVLPEFRKEGINQSLLNYTYEILAPALGIDEAWGEAVCNHLHTQRVVHRYKFIETGLEIDLMPEETFAKEGISSGRITSLVAFRCYVPGPHAVYLPSVYENVLSAIYSSLDDRRTLRVSCDAPPADSSSSISFQIFEFAQVARIEVTAVGEDFESCLNGLEATILKGKTKVLQVRLNLACPWVGRGVEILRGRGYFFGALLPRWFGEDGILMQKTIDRPGWKTSNYFPTRPGNSWNLSAMTVRTSSVFKPGSEDVATVFVFIFQPGRHFFYQENSDSSHFAGVDVCR